MLSKYLLSVFLITLCFNSNAQEFRGIVNVKVYSEKGKMKVLAPFAEDFDEEVITPSMLKMREVDTVFHSYHVCRDTVFHLQRYDSGADVANSSQIGPDFYLASSSKGRGDYYFKFRAPPSQLETANKGKWKRPKRKYRKQGYNGYWEMPLNRLYNFYAQIDTSLTYGWMGHDQGLLNHLFPSKGVHFRVREDRKEDIWIHQYSYEVKGSLSCDSLFSTFQVRDEEVVDVDSLFKIGVVNKDIIAKEERKSFISFEAVDQYDIPVAQKELAGSLTYIDFWASWCAPCLKEMPHLAKLKEHYSDTDVRVVSISIDTKNQALAWRKAMDKYKVDWDSWRVDEGFDCELCQEYNIGSIPRYILLDREGKVMNANAPRPSNPSMIEWLDEKIIEY